MNLSSIAILNIKGFDYCFIISLISKNGPINLLQNNDFGKNRGTFKIEKSIKKFKVYIRIEKTTIKFCDTEIEKLKFNQ